MRAVPPFPSGPVPGDPEIMTPGRRPNQHKRAEPLDIRNVLTYYAAAVLE